MAVPPTRPSKAPSPSSRLAGANSSVASPSPPGYRRIQAAHGRRLRCLDRHPHPRGGGRSRGFRRPSCGLRPPHPDRTHRGWAARRHRLRAHVRRRHPHQGGRDSDGRPVHRRRRQRRLLHWLAPALRGPTRCADAAPVDPEPWLASNRAADVEGSTAASDAGCNRGGPATSYDGNNPDGLVDDPTSEGQITERTAHVLAQDQKNFPESRWACWSERPGTKSEHPLGRACDGTFGNSIGSAATGHALDYVWDVTNWLKDNAETLGVEYLIWQGRIWSAARASEGWRPYGGGGMHDPSSVTGGHYDHLHFTAAG
jgi:hypothetical protein